MNGCKVHPYEPGGGVCASCLRERLLALLAAHPELSAERHRSRRKYDAPHPPPPLHFPRSVSPYLSHRRSLDSERPRHLLFYSTPQVGPTFADAYPSAERPRRRDRFSLLKSLFGNPRSGEPEPDSGSSKGSWFSSLLRRRWRRMKPPVDPLAPSMRSFRAGNRGMSSAMPDCDDDSVSDSGYSTESSSGGWRRPAPTPVRRPSSAARQLRQAGVSGFAMCLSPLVRASPGRQRRCEAADAGFSGDLRHAHHRHASVSAASLGPNRSRKLADFGRSR